MRSSITHTLSWTDGVTAVAAALLGDTLLVAPALCEYGYEPYAPAAAAFISEVPATPFDAGPGPVGSVGDGFGCPSHCALIAGALAGDCALLIFAGEFLLDPILMVSTENCGSAAPKRCALALAAYTAGASSVSAAVRVAGDCACVLAREAEDDEDADGWVFPLSTASICESTAAGSHPTTRPSSFASDAIFHDGGPRGSTFCCATSIAFCSSDKGPMSLCRLSSSSRRLNCRSRLD